MRPQPLRLIIGEPIPAAGCTRADLGALAERTQQAVAELLCEAKKDKQLAVGN
jgi:hypothetical protein